ncbi:MAG: 4'-phosphopantetheinyl transferase superfamily protein, partial [Candidatus Sumerlaeota bacterium]|nr:4'-phosphopantetheinyl transferase superfamily protein [Candidatus Sumerlaeota bacterium]
ALRVLPADIEIVAERGRAPRAGGGWVETIGGRAPRISLTHIEGLAAAVAVDGGCPGVDAERIRERDHAFEQTALGDGEIARLNALAPGKRQRAEWIARFWCAKEAAGKALGIGLPGGPRDAEILDADPATGVVRVRLHGMLAAQLPPGAEPILPARTLRDGDIAAAFCLWEEDREGKSS